MIESALFTFTTLALLTGGGSQRCLTDNDRLSKINTSNNFSRPDGLLPILQSLEVNSILKEQTGVLEIEGTNTLSWKDTKFDTSEPDDCQFSLSLDHLKSGWNPEVFEDKAISSTSFFVEPHGLVTKVEKFTKLIKCETEFDTHPFGNTTCDLKLNVKNDKNFELKWSNVTFQSLQTADLTLIGVDSSTDGKTSTIRLHLTRDKPKVLLMFFGLSSLFMMIALLSLCLGPMAITRIIMLVSVMVLLTLMYHFNPADLPAESRVNPIEIWKIFSFLYVFGILIELVVVILMSSIGRSRCGKKKRMSYELEPLYEEMNDLKTRKTRRTSKCCRVSALVVDIITFFVFLTLFIFFAVTFTMKKKQIVMFINDFDIEKYKIALMSFWTNKPQE